MTQDVECSCVKIEFIKQVGKRNKIRGSPSILSLFRNSFIKFNNTGAGMLESIYQTTLKLLKKHIFDVKTPTFYHLLCNIIMDVTTQYY